MTVSFPKLFKFRPECLDDVDRLGELLEGRVTPDTENDALRDQIVAVNPELAETDRIAHSVGGAIFEFEAKSPEHLASLVGAMLKIADGHRMWQTIDTAEDFTGDFVTDEEARAARILEALGDADPKVSEAYAELMDVPAKNSATPSL